MLGTNGTSIVRSLASRILISDDGAGGDDAEAGRAAADAVGGVGGAGGAGGASGAAPSWVSEGPGGVSARRLTTVSPSCSPRSIRTSVGHASFLPEKIRVTGPPSRCSTSSRSSETVEVRGSETVNGGWVPPACNCLISSRRGGPSAMDVAGAGAEGGGAAGTLRGASDVLAGQRRAPIAAPPTGWPDESRKGLGFSTI